MKQVALKIVGSNTMHCGGCENSVKFVLSDLAGVERVEADHHTQSVRVAYNEEKAEPSHIVEELATLGYQAELATEVP